MSSFSFRVRDSFDIKWPELILEHLISMTKDSKTIIEYIENTIQGEIKIKNENNITTIEIKTLTNLENREKIYRIIRKLLLNSNFKMKYKIEPDTITTCSKILLMEVKNE